VLPAVLLRNENRLPGGGVSAEMHGVVRSASNPASFMTLGHRWEGAGYDIRTRMRPKELSDRIIARFEMYSGRGRTARARKQIFTAYLP
jgi:hypothetical protein